MLGSMDAFGALLAKVLETETGKFSPKIELNQIPSQGHGIVAKADIDASEVLIEIPYSLCITVDLILQSPLGVIFENHPDILSYPDEVLSLGLMYGLINPACAWHSHVTTMPATFNTTLFWRDEELLEVKTSMVYHLTNMMKRQIQNDWDNLHSPLSSNYPELLGGITIDNYKWALSVVYSRALGIHRNGIYIRCIVPIIDMANHNPTAATEAADTFCYNDIDDTVMFVSPRGCPAGAECFAYYGDYCNAKLLHTYGFVIPDNRFRAIDMWPSLSASTPGATEKQQILRSHQLTKEQTYDFTGTLRGNGWISPALLATIRVIQATDDEMPFVGRVFGELSAGSQISTGSKMISVRNETAAYTSLRELLCAKLYPATAESDRVLLAEYAQKGTPNTDEEYRKYAAVVLRIEDREIVQECLDRVNGWLTELQDRQESYCPGV